MIDMADNLHRPFYGLQGNTQPEEVANAMLFLCSELGKRINGAVLPVGTALV